MIHKPYFKPINQTSMRKAHGRCISINVSMLMFVLLLMSVSMSMPNTVVLGTNTVVFAEHLVVFWANTVIVKSNWLVYLRKYSFIWGKKHFFFCCKIQWYMQQIKRNLGIIKIVLENLYLEHKEGHLFSDFLYFYINYNKHPNI